MKWIELVGVEGYEHVDLENQTNPDLPFDAHYALDCMVKPKEYVFDEGIFPRIERGDITVLYHDDDEISDITSDVVKQNEEMMDRLWNCVSEVEFLLDDETLSREDVWNWYINHLTDYDDEEVVARNRELIFTSEREF